MEPARPLPLKPGLPESLGSVSAELQKAFSQQLLSYVSDRVGLAADRSAKIINDPVWRTVRLEPWETFIIDSPVLQRLRRVRQLGLSGLVFPGASYSRFEHSIGVLHQTQRLIDAINRNARARASRRGRLTSDPIRRSDEIMLRVTALVHDCGHCFLSHVSERFFRRLDNLAARHSSKAVIADARSYFGCAKNPALGEIFSALIVLLPEFALLLRAAGIPEWEDTNALCERMARGIVAGIDPRSPYLMELISGALDSDKLDYMPRDCYMAGLPMPVDVDRILEKIEVVRVPISHLPDGNRYSTATGLAPTDVISVLAIQPGGARAFEELVVSRFLLYSKLYYHQKVRCFEGMIVNALELTVGEDRPFGDLASFFTLTDEVFLSEWEPSGPKDAALTSAVSLIRSVADRRSFVRSFAFGPSLVSPYNEKTIRKGWEKLEPLVTAERPPEARQFREEVCSLAIRYLEAAGQASLAQSLKSHDILIDLPDVQDIAEKAETFVGDDQIGVTRYRDRYQVGSWSEAYEDQKTVGYVYTWPQYAVAVYFAFRDLVLERTGLAFSESSWTLTKLSPLKLNDFAKLLGERLNQNYSEFSVPTSIAARSEYLDSTANKRDLLRGYNIILEDLTDRFKTFQSGDFSAITRELIEDWLMQFNAEEIPLVIPVLQNVRYWNRPAFVDALSEGIRRLFPNEPVIQILPIGGPTASGHHLEYYLDDVKKILGGNTTILASESAAHLKSKVPVILYEDNIGIGNQPGTVVQQWFGVPQEQWLVQERHVDALGPDQQDVIRKAKIGLLFITGSRRGLATLEATIRTVTGCGDLMSFVVSPTDINCFQPASRVFRSTEDAARAKAAFRKAGLIALSDRREDWPADRIEGSALGYGNSAQLTVFDYNTPVTTLTALWKACTRPDATWKPLFPRRRRD